MKTILGFLAGIIKIIPGLLTGFLGFLAIFLIIIALIFLIAVIIRNKKARAEKPKAIEKIPEKKIPTGRKRHSLKFVAFVVISTLIVWEGYAYLRNSKMTGSQWRLYWQKASEEKIYGVFRARIEEISPNYIRIVFPGAEGKMLGGSEDGCLYKGVWNDPGERDPKKKMSGKWHFRFVSKDLAVGWVFNESETEKRIIAFQKK